MKIVQCSERNAKVKRVSFFDQRLIKSVMLEESQCDISFASNISLENTLSILKHYLISKKKQKKTFSSFPVDSTLTRKQTCKKIKKYCKYIRLHGWCYIVYFEHVLISGFILVATIFWLNTFFVKHVSKPYAPNLCSKPI